MELMTWIMGGGGLLAIGGIITALSNRRAVRSQARALDAKTPAELDNLVAVTHGQNLKNILDVNAALVKENERIRGINTENGTRLTNLERDVSSQGTELGVISRGLASAYAYITTLLKIIEEHMPGITIPRPPEGYRHPSEGPL